MREIRRTLAKDALYRLQTIWTSEDSGERFLDEHAETASAARRDRHGVHTPPLPVACARGRVVPRCRLRLDTPDCPEAVWRLVHALRPGGALYISLKQDERASAGNGRVFQFWTMGNAIAAIFGGRTPLERVDAWVSVDEGRGGRCERMWW